MYILNSYPLFYITYINSNVPIFQQNYCLYQNNKTYYL